MSDRPCKECNNYDVIIRGKRETAHGWCAAKSTYPTNEGPGQVFPDGVRRAAAGEMAQPVIVKGDSIETRCAEFREKRAKRTKRDLIRELHSKSGKVVLS